MLKLIVVSMRGNENKVEIRKTATADLTRYSRNLNRLITSSGWLPHVTTYATYSRKSNEVHTLFKNVIMMEKTYAKVNAQSCSKHGKRGKHYTSGIVWQVRSGRLSSFSTTFFISE